MRAVILCAGYATRLHPFTERFPKGLLRVKGEAVLETSVRKVLSVPGVHRVSVVTNALHAAFYANWLADFRGRGGPADRIDLLNDGTRSNDERRGGIGDFALSIREHSICEDVLLLGSDRLFSFDLADFAAEMVRRGSPVNACQDVYDPEEIRLRHGCAVVDKDLRITAYEEKPACPRSSIASAAVYAFPADTLQQVDEYLTTGGDPDAPGHYLQWLVERRATFAWLFESECQDIGNAEAYLSANGLDVTSAKVAILDEQAGARGLTMKDWREALHVALDEVAAEGALLAALRLNQEPKGDKLAWLEDVMLSVPLTVLQAPAGRVHRINRADGHHIPTSQGCFECWSVALRTLL